MRSLLESGLIWSLIFVFFLMSFGSFVCVFLVIIFFLFIIVIFCGIVLVLIILWVVRKIVMFFLFSFFMSVFRVLVEWMLRLFVGLLRKSILGLWISVVVIVIFFLKFELSFLNFFFVGRLNFLMSLVMFFFGVL